MFQLQESWSIATLKHGGKEYIVRCNAWLWNKIGDPIYPYKVGIAIPIKETDDNGFPAKTANVKLGELENLIINEMQKNNESLFAGSITGGGIKEFFLYTSNPKEAKKKFNKIKKSFMELDLQLNIAEDKKWEVFTQLCPKL